MATYSKNGKRLGRPPNVAGAVVPLRGAWVARYQSLMAGAVPVRKQSKREFSMAKREQFLEELGRCFNITMAAGQAGVCRSTIGYWRQHNPEFRAAVDEVLAEGYLDAKAKMLALVLDGVRRTKTVRRIDEDTIETLSAGDSVQLILGVMKMHMADVAATNAAQVATMATALRPSGQQMADWLREDIEAIEAGWAAPEDGQRRMDDARVPKDGCDDAA